MELVRVVGRAVLRTTRGQKQRINAIADEVTKEPQDTPGGGSSRDPPETRGRSGEAQEEERLID
eukprot:9742851-Heterocapsa_arctica.AAC.1